MNPPTTAEGPHGSTPRGEDGHVATTGLAPPISASGTAPPVPATAAAARAVVRDLLGYAGISLDSVTAADAILVASELVTNAIRHGGGLTAFRTELIDHGLRLAVGDMSPHPPATRLRTGEPGQAGGYGWPLVQRLSEQVDVHTHTHGKTITAVLRLV
ncbi:ATP-binding protein [Streptomyces sp. NBC_00513]|uniref:ATP-binding protein n=1 Tax=unclassified Streptomyces TaxID=2593676 RepID=UPI00099CC56C|nr:ATP-binding protein [Streptomyces sp. NBC_00424]MCX5077419.1 ATP-binding protein [Streptomyces sp. NBC_00424]WUD39601.1 ATP-binding protein [Streptomyces sp. NBC_00513]